MADGFITRDVYAKAKPLFMRDFTVTHSLIAHLGAQEPPLLNDEDKEKLEASMRGGVRSATVAALFDMLAARPGSEVFFTDFLTKENPGQAHLIKELETLKDVGLEKRSQQLPDVSEGQQPAADDMTPPPVQNTALVITNDHVTKLVKLIIEDEIALLEWMTVVDEMGIKGASRVGISSKHSESNMRDAVRKTLMMYIAGEVRKPTLEDFLAILSQSGLRRLAEEIELSKGEIWK